MKVFNSLKIVGASVFGIGVSQLDSEKDLSQIELRLLALEVALSEGMTSKAFYRILDSDRPFGMSWKIPGISIHVHYLHRKFSYQIECNTFMEEEYTDREVLHEIFYPYYRGRLNYSKFINPRMVGDLVKQSMSPKFGTTQAWGFGNEYDYHVELEATKVIDGVPIYTYTVINKIEYEGTPEYFVYGLLLNQVEKKRKAKAC